MSRVWNIPSHTDIVAAAFSFSTPDEVEDILAATASLEEEEAVERRLPQQTMTWNSFLLLQVSALIPGLSWPLLLLETSFLLLEPSCQVQY